MERPYILKIELINSGGKGFIKGWFKSFEDALKEARKEFKNSVYKLHIIIKKDSEKVWECYGDKVNDLRGKKT